MKIRSPKSRAPNPKRPPGLATFHLRQPTRDQRVKTAGCLDSGGRAIICDLFLGIWRRWERGISAQKRFELPEHELTWISSHEAEIDSPSPQQNAELELILEAVPFLGDGETKGIVKVEANGIPEGTLTLDKPSVHFYSLPLPAAANQYSTIRLRFSCSPAASPAEGGRLLEMGLARLALVPIKPPIVPEIDGNHETVLNRK
jgi:hypothetical protein